MKSREEFKQFGQEHLMPELRRFEKRRRHLLLKIILLLIITAILLVPSLFVLSIPLIHLPSVIALIFLIFTCDELFRKYPADFKNTITPRILTFIDPSLTYSAKDYISKKDFKVCNLFESHVEQYRGSDLVQGRVGNTNIKFSYIKADRSRNDNDSEIFQGLFIVIDMNKEFCGQILVYPNIAEQYLGPFGKTLNSIVLKKGERINLENPKFNDEFAVYSNDQIKARYILTPSLMERILELKENFRFIPSLSFTRSKVYIVNRQFSKTINPNIFKNISDFDSCYDYFVELQKIIGIVNELDLNTRIWTKE